jgi:2,4-dienoyl-CoA reductase-like NADH-dependent reductase (Old Yellow Enzyme family)
LAFAYRVKILPDLFVYEFLASLKLTAYIIKLPFLTACGFKRLIADMSIKLFSPLKLRSLQLKNRIIVSPMCQYSANEGVANDWHMVHLGSRAIGGAAMVIVEATGVSAIGRITPHCLGLWNDEQVQALQPITKFIKEHGSIPGIQLAHAGRKGSTEIPWRGSKGIAIADGGWEVISASGEAFRPDYPTPHAMSTAEIKEVVNQFVEAAKRAEKAGFQAIELHMAHGYLMHQFLSPLSNHRTDEYGGSLENRMRFPLEVAAAVRKTWPDHLPLFVRISATDWKENGWDENQSVVLVKELKKLGVDLIDTSSGGNVAKATIPVGPGYQVPFAAKIKKETDIITGAVGMITEPEQAEEILTSGKADVIIMARELLRDPYWPMHAAKKLGAELPYPVQYERAK